MNRIKPKDVEQDVEAFLPVMLESAHSRFPVISEDKDHIEGILLAKDLLSYAFNAEREFNLRDVLRPVPCLRCAAFSAVPGLVSRR